MNSQGVGGHGPSQRKNAPDHGRCIDRRAHQGSGMDATALVNVVTISTLLNRLRNPITPLLDGLNPNQTGLYVTESPSHRRKKE